MSDTGSETAPAAPASGEVSKDEKTWGLIVHLSALSGFVVPIPFANFVVPLIIWKTKGKEMPFVDDQGKEVINFQITVFIAAVVCALLCLIVIGIFLLIPLVIGALILTIMGALKANDGVKYRYPFAIRLIK